MSESINYFRRMIYNNPENTVVRIYGDKAFFFGIRNKSSFRLIAIAVIKSQQGMGLGTMLLNDMILYCRENKLDKITFRTHKKGRALHFWLRVGAIIIGEKDEDFEMEIMV